jgi:hypothetical protein
LPDPASLDSGAAPDAAMLEAGALEAGALLPPQAARVSIRDNTRTTAIIFFIIIFSFSLFSQRNL